MDYKTYLDFVLAMDGLRSRQGLTYFFRILDFRHRGHLTVHELNYFFRSVVQCLIAQDHPAVEVADVLDEIFDMVRPADPLKITLEDLTKCGVGNTVVSILVDIASFIEYDNRENSLAASSDEEEEAIVIQRQKTDCKEKTKLLNK